MKEAKEAIEKEIVSCLGLISELTEDVTVKRRILNDCEKVLQEQKIKVSNLKTQLVKIGEL